MNFVEDCLDEIALEGLDGITLSALWIRLGARKPTFSLALDDTAKEYIWHSVIRDNKSLEFYELPIPRPPLVLYDRFKHTDLETGVVFQKDEYPEDIYPVCVIKDPGGIMGSCKYFYDRTNVTESVRVDRVDLVSINERWGEKFVIVASQDLRSRALFGCRSVDPDVTAVITEAKYAILERIGRSRFHGELTQSPDGLKVFAVSPKSMFYIRKILLRLGVISVQYMCFRLLNGTTVSGRLIHLTRFYVEFRPVYAIWLEDLTSRLAAKPQQTELYAKIRLEMGLKEKTFRKLCVLGKNNVKSEVLKYRDLYPEASEEEYMTKSKSAERVARIIRLVKPFKITQSLDDDDDDEGEERFRQGKAEDNEHDDELDATVGGDRTASRKDAALGLSCERPMLYQALGCIKALGGRGQSQVELACQLGITRLDGRTITRSLLRKGFTLKVMQDEGKQRISRAVAKTPTSSNSNATLTLPIAQPEAESQLRIPEIKNDDSVVFENSVNQSVDGSCAVDAEMTEDETQEKAMLLKRLEGFPDITTIRTLRRANIILSAVTSAKVVTDIVLIQKKIRKEEAELSCIMDRKSFVRIIDKLCETKKIKQIGISLQLPNGQSKELTFLCDVSIQEDHQLVKSAVEAAQQKLISSSSEASSSSIKSESSAPKVTNEENMVYDLKAGRRYGSLPRMARLKALHELLWCLTYGKSQIDAKDSETESASLTFDPTKLLLSEDVDMMPELFEKSYDTSHINMFYWHKMLPRLPKHAGYGEGWGYVSDILQVIPLFIVCQIITIPYKVVGLEEHLDDLVKRFTPFKQLPVEWQQVISHKRRYISQLYSSCKNLAELGLLTFGKKDFKQKDQCFIYLHKFAKLVDTTIADVARSEFPIRIFKFETFKDVEDYWLSMQSIGFNSPRENFLVVSQQRNTNCDGRFDDCLAEKEVEQVVDIGILPGDGMGAAGIDSTFFVHMRRNWSTNADTVKMEALINDSKYLSKEPETVSSAQEKMKKRKQRITLKGQSLDSPENCNKTGKSGTDPKVRFTKLTATGMVLKKGGQGIKRKHPGFVEGLLKKSKRVREKRLSLNSENTSGEGNEKKKRRPIRHDSKDVDAMRLLKRHRVSWTAQEDSLLLLCQLTNQFLTGNSKLFLVGHAVIRDIMHENLAIARDKTRFACSRRIKYMMKNSATVQNVQMYLGEALQDKELRSEFKDGKRYVATNVTENVPVFKRCLKKMREKFRYENESAIDIPDTLDEFHRQFSVIKSQNSKKTVHQDVGSISEIFFSVLHNLIHSAIVLNDKIGRSHELFQLFRMYPEPVLDSVFTSMKNDKILTRIKQGCARKNRLGGIPVSTIGTYQISQRYMYCWLSTYTRGLFASSGKAIQQLPPSPNDPLFGSDFVLQQNASSDCVITVSLMSLQLITFSTTIPEQIVVIDKMPEDIDLKPPTKRPKFDNESDIEEENLIEEASRMQEQNASKDVADTSVTPSALVYDTVTSSRTANILSCRRCQYVHSQTVHLINANDNLFVNACDVRIQLKPHVLRDARHCKKDFARNSDFEARRKISAWNNTHVVLHPKTCYVILKTIRTTFPDQIKPDVAFNKCLQKLNPDDQTLCTRIHAELNRREFLGMTVYELKALFSDVNGSDHLMALLSIMVDCRLVVRVGVTIFRYVCIEFAKSWLIRIDKNLKGRGHFQYDEDEDVSIMPDEAIPVVDGVASYTSYPPLVETCPPNLDRSERIRSETISLVQFKNQIERNLEEPKAADSAQLTSEKQSRIEEEERNESCPSNGDRNERISQLPFQNQIERKSEESKAADSTQIASGKRCRIEEEEGNGGININDECVTAPPSKCLKLNEEVESTPVSLVGAELNFSESVEVSQAYHMNFCAETLTTAGLRQECEEISLQSGNLDHVSEVELCCPTTVKIECFSESTPDASGEACCPDIIDSANCLSDLQLPFQLADDQPSYKFDDDDDGVISSYNSKLITIDYSSDGKFQNVNGNELPLTLNHAAFDNNEALSIDKKDTSDEADDSCLVNQMTSSSEEVSLGELPASEVVKSSDDGKGADGASTLDDEMLQKSCSEYVGALSVDAERDVDSLAGETDALDSNCLENIDKSSVSHFGSQLDPIPTVLKSPRGSQKSKMTSERQVLIRSSKVKVQSSEISYRLPTWLVVRKSSTTADSQNPQESQEYKEIMPSVANSKVTTSDQISVAASYTMSPKAIAKHSSSSTKCTNSLLNSISTAASITPTNCKPLQNIETSSDAKLPPLVRLGSSGTCTLITVVPSESKQGSVETKFTSAAQNSCVHKTSGPSNQLAHRPLQPSLPRFHVENSPKISHVVLPASSMNNNNASPLLKPAVSVNQNLKQELSPFPTLQPSPGIAPFAPQTPQSIRIRINASSLNNFSSVGDLTKQIASILARQGTLRPGQPIRVHLPLGLSVSNVEKTNGAHQAVESHVDPKESTQPTASSLPSASRIPQLDGATDDHVLSDNCMTPVGTADDSERPSVGQKVEVEQEQNNKESFENRVEPENSEHNTECPLEKNGPISEMDPCPDAPLPTGTYKKVRLIPRPWRTPEGTINRPTLQTMLEALLAFIIENPGSTRSAIVKKYDPVLQPVAVFELLEFLEEIGCLSRMYLKRVQKPSLFSSRSRYDVVSEDTGSETEIFLPTGCCVLKLGQFVVQLTSGIRSDV